MHLSRPSPRTSGGGRGNPPQHSFLTVNGSCWRTCLGVLRKTAAVVVFGQELKLTTEDEIIEAQSQALAAGWKALLAPGYRTEQGGRSCGVGVFVRKELGLRAPKAGHIVSRGRAVAGVVDFKERSWLVASIYLEVGTGMGKLNVEVMAKLGATIAEEGLHWVAGGDFNQAARSVIETGFLARAAAKAWAPTRPTCITGRSSSIIDYFIVCSELASVFDKAVVHNDMDTSPHRPVELIAKEGFTRAKKLVLDTPERLPVDRMIGPVNEKNIVDWSGPLAAVAAARRFAETASLQEADAAITQAYSSFADSMETEVAALAGQELKRGGRRSMLPKLVERPVLDESRVKKISGWTSAARPCRWIANRARELLGVIAKAAGGQHEEAAEQAAYIEEEIQAGGPQEADDFDITKQLKMKLGTATSAILADSVNKVGELMVWQHAADTVESILAGATDSSVQEERANEASSRQRWMQWAAAATAGPAAQAHRFARVPKGWQPTTTSRAGRVTSNPDDLLHNECSRLRGLWNCSDEPPPCDERILPHLGRPQPEKVRKAAASFARGSAVAGDGFHLKHYSWLPDTALLIVIEFFLLAEQRGIFPRQLRILQIFLAEKPQGGLRSLGLFTSLYRLWARVRRGEARCWEIKNQKAYMIFGPGGSAVEAVWRQAARAEQARATGLSSASLLWDLREYYESIDRKDLAERGKRAEFPEAITRASSQMYAASRVVSFNGSFSFVGFALQGVVAGCTFATTHIQYYTGEDLDEHTKAHPHVLLQVFIDDYLQQCIHKSHCFIVETLFRSAKALLNIIEEKFGCTVHTGKAEVIASTAALQHKIMKKMGPLAGRGVGFAHNLGITMSAGRARGTFWKHTKQAARAATGKKRTRRGNRFKRAAGGAAAKLYRTGVHPAMVYGAEVYGLSDKEDFTLRSLHTSAAMGVSGGMSVCTATALLDSTSWRGTAAPLLQWAGEVWRASNRTTLASLRSLDLLSLRRMWLDTLPSKPCKWSQVTGPIGAGHLCCRRLGWCWTAPFTFTTEDGTRLNITETSPKLLAVFIRKAYNRVHEMSAAKRLGLDPLEQPVSLHFARKALRSSKLSDTEKQCLAAIITNKAWTRDRLFSIGAVDSPMCPHCKKHRDSIQHRTFECENTSHIREAVLSSSTARFLLQQGDTKEAEVMCRGWFPRWLTKAGEVCDSNIFAFYSRRGGDRPGMLDFTRRLFADGSCFKGTTPESDRAGWAVIEIDDDGELVSAIAAPVPPSLPQSSQAGEFCGLAGAAQLVRAQTDIHFDFKPIVELSKMPAHAMLSPARCYGGVVRDAVGQPGWKKLASISWCKAHVDQNSLPAYTTEWLQAVGNNFADEWAKKGARLHGAAEKEDAGEWGRKMSEIVTLLAKVGAFSVGSGGGSTKKPRPKRRRRHVQRPPPPRQHDGHHYWLSAGCFKWRCAHCHKLTKSIEARRREDNRGCQDAVPFFDELLANPKGHVLKLFPTSSGCATGAVVACTACGAWSEGTLPKKLRSSCFGSASSASSRWQRQALSNLEKGKHPNVNYIGASVEKGIVLNL